MTSDSTPAVSFTTLRRAMLRRSPARPVPAVPAEPLSAERVREYRARIAMGAYDGDAMMRRVATALLRSGDL